ncbi:MAG: tetratricopeptide repeat protein [Bdellovibrionota bacterium]|jgi:tetratricopeptide (TPR) repeat protein
MSNLTGNDLTWLDQYSNALEAVSRRDVSTALVQLNELKELCSGKFAKMPEYMAPVTSLLGLAELLGGNTQEATAHVKTAKQYTDMVLDEDLLQILSYGTTCAMALVALQGGRIDEACLHYSKVRKNISGSSDIVKIFKIGLSLCFAEISFSQEKYDEAIDYYIEAAQEINTDNMTMGDYTQLAYVQAKVGFAYFLSNKAEDAEKVLQSVLAMREHFNMEISPLFIACINVLTAIYRDKNDARQSLINMEWGVELVQGLYGMDADETIDSLCFFAQYCEDQKDISRAIDSFRTAASWVNKLLEPEIAMWIYKRSISLLEKQGEVAEKEVQNCKETFSRLYTDKYVGDYDRDLAMVQSGDRGDAKKRQEMFLEDMDNLDTKFGGTLLPFIVDIVRAFDGSVYISPVFTACRSYALQFLNDKAPFEVPKVEIPVEEEAVSTDKKEPEEKELTAEEILMTSVAAIDGAPVGLDPNEIHEEVEDEDSFSTSTSTAEETVEEDAEEVSVLTEEDFADRKGFLRIDNWQARVQAFLENGFEDRAEKLTLYALGYILASTDGKENTPEYVNGLQILSAVYEAKGESELAKQFAIRARLTGGA